MNDTEGLQLDPANLSEITINGTMVPMFKQFGKQWYQLITLLRALEFPETGFGGLPTKIGNQFWDSGEFLKYKDIWYGTAKGLRKICKHTSIHQPAVPRINTRPAFDRPSSINGYPAWVAAVVRPLRRTEQ